MSPEMKESLRALEACENEIELLKRRVLRDRDISAAIALHDIAIAATKSFHEIWTTPGPDQIPRREMLWHNFRGRRSLPAFHYWPTNPAKAELDASQEEVIQGIEGGPQNPKRHQGTPLRQVLDEIVMPAFAVIQSRPLAPRGLNGRIWKLPALSIKSHESWADLAVAWLWSKRTHRNQLRRPGTLLHEAARPSNELNRGRWKKKKRLQSWEAGERKKIAEGDDAAGVAETRLQVMPREKKKRIEGMTVTDAHIKNELRAQIVAYWRRNLPPGVPAD